jgi:predicted pyridoxine 5'-phosphate oxidase superfamily flavin-nucleotide-binding protein
MGYQTEELVGMMRNPEQTIGNLIDKQKIAFIASVDENGFPNMKAISERDWQREQLPEQIRDLVLDDQRLRNEICWLVFQEKT